MLATTVVLMAGRTLQTRLQQARKAKEMSTRALDAAAGLTPGHVWQIEAGRKPRIEAETAARLAEVLGVTIDWLIRGVGDGPQSVPPPSKRCA